jgi:hypothetical protein
LALAEDAKRYNQLLLVDAAQPLQAAIRNEGDLLALLPEPPVTSTPGRSIERDVAEAAHAA